MQVHHLIHSDLSIKCKGCGEEFEVSRRVLADPELLLALKEAIAGKHGCRTPRAIRVVEFPTGPDLDAYWVRETRRLAAQM